ncbi:Thioesterase/thiol ester dehydrase-isomerase [Ceratobasidium sp. AG-I]|nr:Thioesterase/thiol ester dehydrase-isomerase [Ceratobasidium sp. AG-I]
MSLNSCSRLNGLIVRGLRNSGSPLKLREGVVPRHSFAQRSYSAHPQHHSHSHAHSHAHSHTHTQHRTQGAPKKTRGGVAAVLAVSLASASYVVGSVYPPTTLQILNPPIAPPAPVLGTDEAAIYTAALEEKLQNLDLVKELRQREGWYESTRPYHNYPEERRRHALVSGTLRGPGKLALPPIVFGKDDETEAIVVVHVGRSLCGHDGIVHGGLLATLLDESLARNALLNLPAKVGVTANLSVNYRAPARADQFIYIQTRLDKLEGRKATVSGTIRSLESNEVLTEANALFVQPKYAHLLNAGGEVQKLLGARQTSSSEVGPDGKKQKVKVPQEAVI